MLAILLLLVAVEPSTGPSTLPEPQAKTLRSIAEHIGARYPTHVPLPIALRDALPETVGELRRGPQGYYGASLLPSLLGARTKKYVACGAAEAAVARYRTGSAEEHALVMRS